MASRLLKSWMSAHSPRAVVRVHRQGRKKAQPRCPAGCSAGLTGRDAGKEKTPAAAAEVRSRSPPSRTGPAGTGLDQIMQYDSRDSLNTSYLSSPASQLPTSLNSRSRYVASVDRHSSVARWPVVVGNGPLRARAAVRRGATPRDGSHRSGPEAHVEVIVPEICSDGEASSSRSMDSKGGSGGGGGGAVPSTVTSAAMLSALLAEPASSEQIDAFFNFNPVCPAADGLFRMGQQGAMAVAGSENIENYRPLINDVLIRVRTEICVLESFVRETATPFIQEKGLGWVLPMHETSETYLAGVVFMVGANFILLGSTKVVAILAIYADLLTGLPARLLGKALSAAEDKSEERYNKQMEKLMAKQMEEIKGVMKNTAQASARESKTAEVNSKYNQKMEELKARLDGDLAKREGSTLGKASQVATAAAVPLRIYGKSSLTIRQVLEVFDTFCSRYFVTFTVTYIIIKTLHYVFFPDIFP
eukprot:jgi/Tetstr1/461632/TSEL_006732.t1